MTDTPHSSSEPQKPATPAPTPQQDKGTPQPKNNKPGQQQKWAPRAFENGGPPMGEPL